MARRPLPDCNKESRMLRPVGPSFEVHFTSWLRLLTRLTDISAWGLAMGPTLSDSADVTRVSPGDLDEAALGQLFDTHRQVAFNLAYRMLRQRDDAADAVQEAFLRAIRAIRGGS